MTYIGGSLRSGASCSTATTVEDDNAIGADENDPVGASISGSTVTIINSQMAPGNNFVVTFNAQVN
ncbi:MAG: hypothetical protein HC843_10220 [Sphingomonadales bacterium]|nr:hypothetical protein [Sphingomonadales bacterium]